MNREKKKKTEIKKGAVRSAKECAYLAVFVAVVIAMQFVFSAIPGVEIVTPLFVCYAFVFGWKRGMAAATVFSLMRQLIFGFFPTVLIVYLVYYNLLTLLFGVLGKWIKTSYKWLPLLIVIACICTVCFTLIDDVITPIWYGYTAKATRAYFYASLPFMGIQTACTAIAVGILFLPLQKAFEMAGKPILHGKIIKNIIKKHRDKNIAISQKLCYNDTNDKNIQKELTIEMSSKKEIKT